MNLIKSKSWDSRLYKAHRSSNEFQEILWETKFPPERLKAIKKDFVDAGDSAGYAQEYLNDPTDDDDKYLRESDLLPMAPEHHEQFMRYYVGVDFAISKADASNRTSMTVGGKDAANYTNIVDQRVGRIDSLQIVEELFSIQERWKPDQFFVEGGQIWKAIEPMLMKEMLVRDRFISFTVLNPVSDKKVRGRAFQKRTRAGAVRFNKLAEWWDDYREEILRFTGNAEAVLDDQFDSSATLFLGLESAPETEDDDALTDEDIEMARQAESMRKAGGRSMVTGY